MKNYKEIADKLLLDLNNSPYYVSGGTAKGGLSIQVGRDTEKICFDHNLGASNVPTKKQAEEMLYHIKEHVEQLCAASPNLVEFIDKRRIELSLIVFSGHMDFDVAKMVEGEITWFSNLK